MENVAGLKDAGDWLRAHSRLAARQPTVARDRWLVATWFRKMLPSLFNIATDDPMQAIRTRHVGTDHWSGARDLANMPISSEISMSRRAPFSCSC